MARVSWYKKVASGIKGKKYRAMGDKRRAVLRFVMGKFKRGALHRRGKGGKTGPRVTSRAQALAIAYNTAGHFSERQHLTFHVPRT